MQYHINTLPPHNFAKQSPSQSVLHIIGQCPGERENLVSFAADNPVSWTGEKCKRLSILLHKLFGETCEFCRQPCELNQQTAQGPTHSINIARGFQLNTDQKCAFKKILRKESISRHGATRCPLSPPFYNRDRIYCPCSTDQTTDDSFHQLKLLSTRCYPIRLDRTEKTREVGLIHWYCYFLASMQWLDGQLWWLVCSEYLFFMGIEMEANRTNNCGILAAG